MTKKDDKKLTENIQEGGGSKGNSDTKDNGKKQSAYGRRYNR
jgi:hypothetical protein